MTSQNVFIPFNFENTWIFCKIYPDIYCNLSLETVKNVCKFAQQFSLQITRTLSIEFVELLHYLMYKTNRFRFSVRVCCNKSQKTL